MSTDPWAAAHTPEMRRRLAVAGATADEVDAFVDQWEHDLTWPHDEKLRVFALGDAKLADEVLAARADGRRDTETDTDEADRLGREAAAAHELALREQALELSAYEPSTILGWAGHDPHRIRAMLDVEEEHARPRSGLVAALVRQLPEGG